MSPELAIGISSGRAKCGFCGQPLPKDIPTVRSNLGSGKYARTYPLKSHRYSRKSFGEEKDYICQGFLNHFADFIVEVCEVFQE